MPSAGVKYQVEGATDLTCCCFLCVQDFGVARLKKRTKICRTKIKMFEPNAAASGLNHISKSVVFNIKPTPEELANAQRAQH